MNFQQSIPYIMFFTAMLARFKKLSKKLGKIQNIKEKAAVKLSGANINNGASSYFKCSVSDFLKKALKIIGKK